MRSAIVEIVLLVQALLGTLVRTDNNSSGSVYQPSCNLCDEEAYCCHGESRCCLKDRLYEQHELWRERIVQPRYDCEETVYIKEKNDTNYLSYNNSSSAPPDVWMINRCIYEAVPEALLCESPDRKNITQLVPVSSQYDHYRNKFCALCNGVIHWIDWSSELYCDINITLSSSLLSEVRKQKCNIFFRPPENTVVHTCFKMSHQVSNCTATVRLVNRPCNSSLYKPYYSYFCYYCETDPDRLTNKTDTFPWSSMYPTTGDAPINRITPVFTGLINLNSVPERKKELGVKTEIDDKKEDEDECNPSTHFDDKKMKKCRRKFCHEERFLQNDDCMPSSETVSTSCRIYLFLIKFIPVNPWIPDNFTEDMLGQENLQREIRDSITGIILDAAPATYITIQEFKVYKKSDSFLVEYLVIQILVDINWFHPDMLSKIQNVLAKAVFPLLPLIYFSGKLFMYELGAFDFNGMVQEPSFYGLTTDPLQPVTLKITSHYVNLHHCHSNCNKLNKCSYLKIQTKEFPVKTEKCHLSIDINETTFIYSKWQYKISENDIYLCLADYNEIYDALLINPSMSEQDSSRVSGKVHPKDSLALFCVCCSIIGLLITLFTYIVFPELHSQSAINNMILCVCLLLAQAMYQFGAGQNMLPRWACALIGALCHFLWLSVMFAMNVCVVQMYNVFKSLRKLPPGITWKHTIRNCVYVFLSALLLVLVNIAVSLSLSNGEDSGYGGSICYLSSQALHIITFIIPSAATIIVNIILFAIVVIRIKSAYIKSANLKQERNYLGIYARLSTVTGLTWIFGYLHVLLESELFEYFFVILNAGQGVLIMIAFVLNKRVRSLYCKKESYQEGAQNRQP